MKFLLDTHVWYWLLSGTGRWTSRSRAALESPDNELWLSPISAWEVMRLGDSGRLRLNPDPVTWVRASLTALPLREAALSHEVALASRRIALSHEDPADRFLAATAKIFDLSLVTADERLLACREIRTLRA